MAACAPRCRTWPLSAPRPELSAGCCAGSTGVPNPEANTSPWSCHWSPQPISLWLRQEFREDLAMQALVIATIPSVAAVLTAALGFRDLGMRRKLETSKQFLALFATAHGRPVDERDHVGIGEQVASIHLIADFAASENSSGTRLVRDSRTSLRGRDPRTTRRSRRSPKPHYIGSIERPTRPGPRVCPRR